MLFDLTGSAAIVTGAAAGIGQGMGIALAEAGADIIGVDLHQMDETQKQVEALGRRFISIQQNLIELEQIPGIVEKCVTELGKVDILINCAGMSDRGHEPQYLSWEEYEFIIKINLNSMVKLSLETYKQMIKQGMGGKIINITSILGVFASEGSTAYSTSKTGIVGLTKAMAVAGAKHGIWVNAVAPASIVTTMLKSMYPVDQMDKAAKLSMPTERMGYPEDLKGLAIFLASKESDFVTGQIICADGGIASNNKFHQIYDFE